MRQSLIRWRSASPEQTEAYGSLLARNLPPRADAPTVIYLEGDLGSGKTTLAKGFIRGCGITEPVRSPTYALLEPYETLGFTVLHLDLYRLRDPSELEPLGLRDWAGPGHVWLIEWPGKGGTQLHPPDVQLALAVLGDSHEIVATSVSAFGRSWLQHVNTA